MKAGPGRPPGAPNKLTKAFKEALVEVFERTGGVTAMVAWAKQEKNRADFYKIMARLIPHEVVGPGANGEHLMKNVVDEHHP